MSKKQLAFAIWPNDVRAPQRLRDVEAGYQRLSLKETVELVVAITRITGSTVILDYLADNCGYSRGQPVEVASTHELGAMFEEANRTANALQQALRGLSARLHLSARPARWWRRVTGG